MEDRENLFENEASFSNESCTDFEEVFTENENPKEPIKILKDIEKIPRLKEVFQFLSKDFESIGFNDALVVPDLHHAESRVESICKRFQVVLEKHLNEFDMVKHDIEFHVITRESAGLLCLAEKLKAELKKIESQIKRLDQMMENVKNKTGEFEHIKHAYMIGFKKGLAAISGDFLEGLI